MTCDCDSAMALLLLIAVSCTSVSSFLIIDAEPGIQVGISSANCC